jgi:hypothetical protein
MGGEHQVELPRFPVREEGEDGDGDEERDSEVWSFPLPDGSKKSMISIIPLGAPSALEQDVVEKAQIAVAT